MILTLFFIYSSIFIAESEWDILDLLRHLDWEIKNGEYWNDTKLYSRRLIHFINLTIPDFAWEAIGNIRRSVFAFLSKNHTNNYILTNYLADTAEDEDEDKEVYEQVRKMAETRESLFIPIALQISKEEHLRRLRTCIHKLSEIE